MNTIEDRLMALEAVTKINSFRNAFEEIQREVKTKAEDVAITTIIEYPWEEYITPAETEYEEVIAKLEERIEQLEYNLENDIDFRLNNLDRQIKTPQPMLVIPFDGNRHDANILSCPCCGGQNLHPDGTSSGTDSDIRSENVDYTYTQIHFWCEGCSNNIGLRMRFHKGSTYMTWQINDKPTKLDGISNT